MIHAGELKHLAQFSEPTIARTHGDTTLDTFVTSFERWVAIDPVGTVETEAGDALQGARFSVVKMRYEKNDDTRVHRQLRMRCRGRDFEVTGVLNVGERDYEWQLQVRELA